MVTEKIKEKRIENMKTSEIIDLLTEDHSESEFDELDKELIDRYPFNYYLKTKFEEIEQQIELLNKLLRHDHKDGEIVIKL
jgi:hypothetical protein